MKNFFWGLLRDVKRLFFPAEHTIVGRFWKRRAYILHGRGFRRLLKPWYMLRNSRILVRYNASIPTTDNIAHFTAPHGFSGIYISSLAHVGEGCTLFQQVTVGSNALPDSPGAGAPTIGRNVFIGAGAKIIGNVTVGDNARIGAGCVVAHNVPANATVVMPAPRVILHGEPRDNAFRSAESE